MLTRTGLRSSPADTASPAAASSATPKLSATNALRAETHVGDIIAIKHHANGAMGIVCKVSHDECEVETIQFAEKEKTICEEFKTERTP